MTGLFAFLLSPDRGFSHHVHTCDLAGRGLRRVSPQRAIGRPSFSPDGTRLVFPGPVTDDSDGRYGLYVVGVNGSGLRRITAPAVADHDPAWSPDGRTIAYARDIAGGMNPGATRLFVTPSGGGGQWQRIAISGARSPAWSPDSKQIAFTALGTLWVVGSDGSGLRSVAGGGARFPTWSPDGGTIAFVQQLRADRSRLVTVPAAGGAITLRSDLGGQVEDPHWSADGRSLHCILYRGQGYDGRTEAAVWEVPADAAARQLARFGTQVIRLGHHPDPPPGPVTGLLAQVTQRTVHLTWTPPPDSDLVAFDVHQVTGPTPSLAGDPATLAHTGRAASAFLHTGIEPSTVYSFTVYARDRAGNRSAPATTTVTTPPPGPPDPPLHVEAVPGNRRLRVTWEPPFNDGGSPITQWTITTADRTVQLAPDVTWAVLGDLNPGQTYVVTVTAHNALGPSAPATVTVQPDNGTVEGTFTAQSPIRLLDTREVGGAVVAGSDRTVPVLGRAGVPADRVSAIAATFTVTQPTASGYLTAYPGGTARPHVSTLNYSARTTVANADVVPLGGGAIALGVMAGSAHVVADVAGFFAARNGVAGGRLNAVPPRRVLDTRESGGAIAAGASRAVRVGGTGSVPVGAAAAVLVVTCVQPTATTFLTVHPSGEPLPRASAVSCAARDTVAVLVTTRVGADGRVAIYNAAGSAHVVADVLGWYTATSDDAGETFHPVAPARVLDTRHGVGAPVGALGPEGVLVTPLRERGGIGSDATTVLVNLTAVGGSASTYLTVFPAGRLVVPRTSVLNVAAGRTIANLVLAKLNPEGELAIRNAAGSVHVVADVRGYFAP